MKICNPEETCRYARPVSVTMNSNTGWKCWPCLRTTPSHRYQTISTEFTEYYHCCLNTVFFSIQKRVNKLRPRQNGRYSADDIFKCIFMNGNVWIVIKMSLNFFSKGRSNNIPAVVQIMAWRRPGDKPLSEPIMVRLPTHICVTRPQYFRQQYFRHRYYCQSSQSMCDHIYNFWQIKGQSRTCWLLA